MQGIKQIIGLLKGNIAVGRFVKVFSVDVVVKGINFLLIPAFLHLMTQQEVGTYDYLYAFAFAIAPCFNLGFYVAITKMYYLYPDTQKRGTLLFTLNTSLMVFLLLVFTFIYGTKLDYQIFDFLVTETIDYQTYRFLILIAVVAMIYNVLLTMFFVTSEKIAKIQRYNIGRCLVVNIAVFAALFLLKGDKIAIRLAFTYIAELLVMGYFFRHFVKEMVPTFSFEMLKRALKIGLPVMLSSVAYLFINFADKYFVQRYCGIEEFAVYFKALQFALIIAVVFGSFQNVWIPLMMKEQNLKALERKINKIALIAIAVFTLFSALLFVAVWCALKLSIIPINYWDMLYVLPLTCLGQISAALLLLYQYYTYYFEKTHITLVFLLVFGSLSVFCNYFAVQWFSYYGVAMVTIFINLSMTLAYYLRAKKYIKNRL